MPDSEEMNDGRPKEDFGCKRCWPPAADAAWRARGGLTHVADLIDESHFHVMILACPHCTQRFVSVFTERIDWVDGDDPQAWTLLPLTGEEAAGLVQQRESLTESGLLHWESAGAVFGWITPRARPSVSSGGPICPSVRTIEPQALCSAPLCSLQWPER